MPYRIQIDRSLCTRYAECVGLAPEVFQLGDDKVSVVIDPEGADEEAILDAARACPVDAITLIDEFEEQVWPHSAAPVRGAARLAHRFSEPMDARHVAGRHEQVAVLRADPEPIAPPQELLLRCVRGSGVVHAHVMQVYPAIVLAVEAPDVGYQAVGLEHHRDAVQLLVAGMEHVAGHAGSARAAAPKWRSKAAVRSAAIACGERPSIWCRCTKWTTSPSLSSAMDGLLG